MPDWLRRWVLRWLRVPAEPEPPAGDPSSLRVFRAAPRYFRYKLIGWGIGQLGTLIGLAVGFIIGVELLDDWLGSGLVGTAVAALGALAWLGFLAQVPFSYGALRLDYELRWYMLSDRALRIREGVIRVREMTMTFANIQQIKVKQGPLQRLLGIADIEVRTAGGGASEEGDDMHRGYFRGVADPETVRDTIRDRVREYRDAGLGDPELGTGRPADALAPGDGGARGTGGSAKPAGAYPVLEPAGPGARPAIEAARELLEEVRALRSAYGV